MRFDASDGTADRGREAAAPTFPAARAHPTKAMKGVEPPNGPGPRAENLMGERDGMAMVTLLIDAWRGASGAATTRAALETLAETAKRGLRAESAVLELVTTADPREERPTGNTHTLDIPVIGLRGQPIASLGVVRDPGDAAFAAEDEALGHALALMAAIVIERDASDRNLRAVLEHAPAAIFLKDRDLRYILGNRRAAEMLGVESPARLIGFQDSHFLPSSDATRIMASDRAILNGEGDVDTEEAAHWPLGGRRLHVHAFGVKGDDGEPIGVGGVVTDVTAHRLADEAVIASEASYRRLLENALDAIVIADDAGRSVEVNPAMCALVGWSREELVGRKLAELVVDGESEAAGEGHWTAFRAGQGAPAASKGYVRMRRRDGTICEAEYTVAANVEPGIHLGVFRDATERRQSERLTRQRQKILEALVRMPADATVTELSQAVCQAMVVSGGFPQVAIISVEPPSRIAIIGAAMDPETRAAGLPPVVEGPRAEAIIARARSGAWVDDGSDARPEPSHTLVQGSPISAVAWAPIEADGRVIALLAVGGTVPAAEQQQRLSYLVDLASIIAYSTLGRSLREHSTRVASRTRIQTVLDAGAFHAVFQPLVDVESGQVIGYEALTRFSDGGAPDVVFAEAAASGISLDLEIATARVALEAAGSLPANRPININVSPELILAREPLGTMLRRWGFGVVLEITEHSEVTDYAALRAAILELGPQVQLAVDDAGAGFSSLRHILELGPTMVKLDITLIRDIDTDLARQALVAGMVHFAGRMEITLLAEGVETDAERATLMRLGVTRGQGYLFGYPAPAETLSAGLIDRTASR